MTARTPVLGTAREWAIDLSVATALGMFLGVVGPFGSYFNGPVLVRAFYWTGCFWAGAVIFGLSVRLAIAGATRLKVPAWTMVGAAILAACAVQTAVVAPLASTLWPFLKRLSPLDWYGQCLAISGPIAVGFTLLRARLQAARAVPAVPGPQGDPSPVASSASPRTSTRTRTAGAAAPRSSTGPSPRGSLAPRPTVRR